MSTSHIQPKSPRNPLADAAEAIVARFTDELVKHTSPQDCEDVADVLMCAAVRLGEHADRTRGPQVPEAA